MLITSPILFHILSQMYDTKYDTFDNSVIPLKTVKIGTPFPEAGAVHILNGDEAGRLPPEPGNSAYIILGSHDGINYAPNVAYIPQPVSPAVLAGCVSGILYSLQEWDCRLKDILLEGRGLEVLFKVAREILDYSFAVVNVDLQNVAHSPDYLQKFKYFPAEPDRVADSAALELFLDDEFREGTKADEVFFFPEGPCDDRFLCRNITENGQNAARFHAILDRKDVSRGELQLFSHISEYVRKLYLGIIDDRFMRRRNDRLHQLIHELLFKRTEVSARDITGVLASVGWDREDTYSVTAVNFIDREDFGSRARYLCRKLEEICPGSCTVNEGAEIFWVINHTKSPVFGFSDYSDILRDLVCKTGTGDEFSDFCELGAYARQAAVALSIGDRENGHFWHHEFRDYKPEYIMERITGEFTPRQIAHEGLLRLMEYDRRTGMNYTESLRIYIENRFNASVSADELFMHRSTFLRRLERIEQIAGINLSDQDDILYLMISMKLLRTRQEKV